MMALYILIWLSGYLASYFLFRKACKDIDPPFTNQDRITGLGCSIISWLYFGVLVALLVKEGMDAAKYIRENKKVL